MFQCCQGCIGLIRWSVQSISVIAMPGNALERSWRNAIKWQFKLTLVKFAEKIRSKCINVITSAIWNLSLIYSWWFFDPINSHLYSIWTKFSVVFEDLTTARRWKATVAICGSWVRTHLNPEHGRNMKYEIYIYF